MAGTTLYGIGRTEDERYADPKDHLSTATPAIVRSEAIGQALSERLEPKQFRHMSPHEQLPSAGELLLEETGPRVGRLGFKRPIAVGITIAVTLVAALSFQSGRGTGERSYTLGPLEAAHQMVPKAVASPSTPMPVGKIPHEDNRFLPLVPSDSPGRYSRRLGDDLAGPSSHGAPLAPLTDDAPRAGKLSRPPRSGAKTLTRAGATLFKPSPPPVPAATRTLAPAPDPDDTLPPSVE